MPVVESFTRLSSRLRGLGQRQISLNPKKETCGTPGRKLCYVRG